MKELSIKEKAERYDKLLVKLYEAKVDNNVCDERYCCVIDDIVPELKESEDEQIRQRIIHALHGDVLEMSEIKEAIDWLEKQGEKKSPYLCGYVARDKNGLLHVFEVEPRRSEDYWWDLGFWSVLIAHDAFPDLKWEDEPIYVRLLIVKSE